MGVALLRRDFLPTAPSRVKKRNRCCVIWFCFGISDAKTKTPQLRAKCSWKGRAWSNSQNTRACLLEQVSNCAHDLSHAKNNLGVILRAALKIGERGFISDQTLGPFCYILGWFRLARAFSARTFVNAQSSHPAHS